MIRTVSKAPRGHYRAGQYHSPHGSEWPDGQFSKAQLQQLRDDPRLTVENPGGGDTRRKGRKGKGDA